MGCGMPAAIGASFARGKGEVLCLVGDGGMMLNMQELQTIAHHQLPIKIIVFENDGYSMIKGTHKNMNLPYAGVDRASGVSMPDFCKLAAAFNISTCSVNQWDTLRQRLGLLFKIKGPFLMVINIDPEQEFVPRLKPIMSEGKITPARFDQLSPITKPVTLVEADLA
jgi:acetolactate synthase-1/2/3 large subunit